MSSLEVDKIWKYYMYMSVHTRSMSLSKADDSGLFCKRLTPSLSLPTYTLICPFIRWWCWGGLAKWTCRLQENAGGLYSRGSGTGCTYQQEQGGMRVSESSRALSNFPWYHLLGWPQAHSVLRLLHLPIWEKPRYKAWVKGEATSSLGRTQFKPCIYYMNS